MLDSLSFRTKIILLIVTTFFGLAAGVALSGFAAFRVARTNAASRGVAGRLGLTAYGANLAVPLA